MQYTFNTQHTCGFQVVKSAQGKHNPSKPHVGKGDHRGTPAPPSSPSIASSSAHFRGRTDSEAYQLTHQLVQLGSSSESCLLQV